MGSTAAMKSIDRVLKRHGRELKKELREHYPSKLIRRFTLGNELYVLSVQVELTDGTILDLDGYDIDDLAERFPDCEVGY